MPSERRLMRCLGRQSVYDSVCEGLHQGLQKVQFQRSFMNNFGESNFLDSPEVHVAPESGTEPPPTDDLDEASVTSGSESSRCSDGSGDELSDSDSDGWEDYSPDALNLLKRFKFKVLSKDEWTFVLAYMVVFHNISRKVVDLLLYLFNLKKLYKVTRNSVYRCMRQFLLPYDLKTVKLCPECVSSECSHKKTAILTTANIIPQIRTICEENSDVLDSVELTINTDGVKPRDHKANSFWPLFLIVQNLPPHRRGLRKNCIFAGLLSGVEHPSTALLGEAQRHLLQHLPQCTLNVSVDSHIKTFPVTLNNGVFDTPAYSTAYDLTHYNSRDPSCRRCLQVPVWLDGAMRYHLFVGHNDVLRTPGAIEPGIRSVTVMAKLLPITKVRTDWLHVVDEGVITKLLNLMFTGKKSPMYLGAFGNELLKTYSASEGRISSSEKKHSTRFSELSGHEKRFLFADIMPAALVYLWTKTSSARPGVVLLVALWVIFRILAVSTDEDELKAAANTLAAIGEPFEVVFGPRFRSMKCHLLFAHGPQEIRETAQSFMNYSASTFESFNKDIQKLVNHANTRGFHQALIERHLLHVAMTAFFRRRTNSADFTDFYEHVQGKVDDTTAYPRCRYGKVKTFLDEVIALCPAAENAEIVSKGRIGSDLVKLTDSKFYLRFEHDSGLAVVRPLLGIKLKDEVLVYVEQISVTDPFVSVVRGMENLRHILRYQKYCYVLDDDVLSAERARQLVKLEQCKAYLFPLKVLSTTYLVDGTERVSRL